MAKKKGQYAKVVADFGGTEVTVLELRNWSVSANAEELDGSVAGQEWKEFESGQKEWEGEAETIDADTFYIEHLGEKATIKFYDHEDDTDYLTGQALLMGVDKDTSYDDFIEQSLSFKGTGALEKGTDA